MAVQLAPYNNAMRLGQGFNSYTQQICLTDAVMQASKTSNGSTTRQAIAGDGPMSSSTDEAKPSTGYLGKGHNVSQIVSYSSRFVEKLSDLTDAMNISASLSIKTATIGGSASGSFVNSDKFKESDINYFVQVKVVNQVIFGEDYTEFQNVLPAGAKFSEVYGDMFISGFELGGELNALISVKCSDKSKTFAIKAELEATLGTPALSGQVKGGVDLEKSELKSSTETTVTVNWSGGGQIKPSDAIWDVNSLTLAACNFPDLVAETPQRTYAILSKYTTLKSFLSIYKPTSVLTYENAGVYTSALLDMYMDYKSIWKQIQIANSELQKRRADIKAAKPSQEVKDLATKRQALLEAAARQGQHQSGVTIPIDPNRGIAMPVEASKTEKYKAETPPKGEATESSVAAVGTGRQGQELQQVSLVPALVTAQNEMPSKQQGQQITIPDLITFEPYTPTVLGLDRARRDCRNEMVKIVNEVDQVTTYPELALDPRREDRFVSPRVFTQLLPVVTLRAVETDKDDSNLNPKNLVILGETNEPPVLQQWLYNRLSDEKAPPPFDQMAKSLDKNKTKSKRFDMGDDWCGVRDLGKTALFFNSLDFIDETWLPKTLSIWVKDEILIGIKVFYTNGKEMTHGECPNVPSQSIEIQDGQAEGVIQMLLEAAEVRNATARVRSIRVTLDSCKVQEFPAVGRPVTTQRSPEQTVFTAPSNGFWTFRGFWGVAAPYQGGFPVLGVVWGQGEISKKPGSQVGGSDAAAAATDYQMFVGRTLPEQALLSATQYRKKAGTFSMSTFIGDDAFPEGAVYFNDLESVEAGWLVDSIKFYDNGDCITGYIINYVGKDNQFIRRGKIPPGELGHGRTGKPKFWKTVRLETTRPSDESEVSVLSSVRLINIRSGPPDEWSCVNSPPATAEATLGRPARGWSLVGFWGYQNPEKHAITHLGAIWAKTKELE